MNTPLIQYVKNLVPLCELHGENFDELVRSLKVETLPAGKKLFKAGESDDKTYYLLAGELEMGRADGQKSLIKGGSQQARFPLDHHRPRQCTAITTTEIHFLRIDNSLLDILLTWDQNASYVVNEINEETEVDPDNDWMTNILRSKVFLKIPPANIQAMFMRIQALPVNKDEIIIKQGEEADYYYMIKTGRCAVFRNAPETGNKNLKIAELGPGQGFGEDALMSEAKRNATIVMQSEGTLMRLSKEDFDALLKAPVMNLVSYDEGQAMQSDGAVWLDVRLQSEHQNNKIAGSINVPLYLLRLNAQKLSTQRKYILYCDSGRRAASAAFTLNQYGFDTYVLKDGLMGIQEDLLVKTA